MRHTHSNEVTRDTRLLEHEAEEEERRDTPGEKRGLPGRSADPRFEAGLAHGVDGNDILAQREGELRIDDLAILEGDGERARWRRVGFVDASNELRQSARDRSTLRTQARWLQGQPW
jgi:hypothetical protein